MKRNVPYAALTAIALCAMSTNLRARTPQPEKPPPVMYDVVVLNAYPHDTSAFTQGLFIAKGALYESTGMRGASVIRRVDRLTGKTLAEVRLPDDVFGEGAVAVGERIISLSWLKGQGFVHDLETLSRLETFSVKGEGWGLAYDGARLILSDGTSKLRFIDPDTYQETGSLEVTLNGVPTPRLNELEWVENEIWANVWRRDAILRIDPQSGDVTGVIDVSALFPVKARKHPEEDVPNGIAYDARSKQLFITGKRWPHLFEVKLERRN